MGNVKSRLSDYTPVRKCQKTEITSDINNCSTLENQLPSVPLNQTYSQRWESMPYVALVEVYKHLSNNDKARMGLTCKAWLLPFTRPALWRRGNFRFDGEGDRRAMQFAALMGAALRHVFVDCSAPKEKVSCRGKASAVNFCLFLTSLMTADNRRLETVCVRNVCRLFRYWIHQSNNDDVYGSSMNPLHLMTGILEKQDLIRILDVTNAGFLTDQAIRLLGSVQHPEYVKELSIADIVAQIQRFDLSRHPRFISTIACYTGLSELRLSEEYISHELLMALSSSVTLTLRFLEVKALYNLRRHPSEDLEESWDYFCSVMTKLELSFLVKGVFAGRDIVRVLPSTLRLSRLEWDLGNSVMDFKAFYLHLMKFRKSLRYLRFSAYIAIETDVNFLYYIVQRLPNLRVLGIESPMIPPPILYQLERSLRRCLNSGQAEDRALKEVVINGERLGSTETWFSYIAGLMIQHM